MNQLEGVPPVDVSVNVTVRGASPVEGFKVKPATGAAKSIVLVVDAITPLVSFTVRVTL
jgi:hypothetical protein